MRATAQSPPADGAQVVVIIADGVRPDVLTAAINRGDLPALAALRNEGSLSTITSAFPSVTGPAYAPFLMGKYPGTVGLPGLRWFDRTRRIGRLSGFARSYVGIDMRFVDRDIDPASPTIFELAKPGLGALSVITRGLHRRDRLGQSPSFVARAESEFRRAGGDHPFSWQRARLAGDRSRNRRSCGASPAQGSAALCVHRSHWRRQDIARQRSRGLHRRQCAVDRK